MIRAAGESFFERSQKWFTWLHLKVLNAILRCRTAALGGHVDACSGCGHQAVSFNSCRNRHCPKCQANARDRWLEARGKELLPTRYVHVVFTLPRQLSPLALQNKREIYALLFRASAETLLQVARDPEAPRRRDRILQRPAHLEPENDADCPHCPRVVSACLSAGAARRCFEPARHPNPRGEFPRERGELLVRASAGLPPPAVRSCGDSPRRPEQLRSS